MELLLKSQKKCHLLENKRKKAQNTEGYLEPFLIFLYSANKFTATFTKPYPVKTVVPQHNLSCNANLDFLFETLPSEL